MCCCVDSTVHSGGSGDILLCASRHGVQSGRSSPRTQSDYCGQRWRQSGFQGAQRRQFQQVRHQRNVRTLFSVTQYFITTAHSEDLAHGGMARLSSSRRLVTYRDGLHACQRLPIQILTGPGVDNFRRCDQRRYQLNQTAILDLSCINKNMRCYEVIT